MFDAVAWPADPLAWGQAAAVRVVVLTTAAVLTAVAWNFLRAGAAGGVAARRRSPVATATMLLFTFAVYLLVHHHVGVLPPPPSAVEAAMLALGTLLSLAGCVVNLLGRRGLGRNWADQVTLYRTQTLVTTGVFALVRHPLYASLIWMFYGAALIYRNWAAALAVTLVFIPAMVLRAGQEERLLEAEFPEYAAYRRRVGRLLPRLLR